MIMTMEKMNEMGQKLVGKKLSQDSINAVLSEMGFIKLPKIGVPARVHTTPDGNWAALAYNNMSIRLGVDSDNFITDSGEAY